MPSASHVKSSYSLSLFNRTFHKTFDTILKWRMYGFLITIILWKILEEKTLVTPGISRFIKAEQFLEPKSGIPPMPKHLAFLEDYVKDHKIKAVVLPTYYSRSAANTLAKRIGVKAVIVAQSVGEVPGTDDLFSFFDYNVEQISEVLK